MREHLRAVAVTASALALVGGTATTAHAATYDIKVAGGYTPDPAPVNLQSVGGFESMLPSVDASCTSSSRNGSLDVGPSVDVAQATIGEIAFTGCLGPGGLPLEVTSEGGWQIAVTSGGPTVWDGYITGINAHVSDSVGGTICQFDVTGSVGGTFDETTQTVTATSSNLTVSNVQYGCLNLVFNGDPAEVSVTYSVTNPATGAAWPIDIT